MRTPPHDPHHLDRSAAPPARLPRPPVHLQSLQKTPPLPIRIPKIAERRPPMPDRLPQHPPYRPSQTPRLRTRHRPRHPRRVNPRPIQRLIRINIPQPRNPHLIQQHPLHRPLRLQYPPERPRPDPIRLRPQPRHPPRLHRLVRPLQRQPLQKPQPPEPPRIHKPNLPAIFQPHHKMRMLRPPAPRPQPHTPRHPQLHHQTHRPVRRQNQPLAPPPHRRNPTTLQHPRPTPPTTRKRPTHHTRLPQTHPPDPCPHHLRPQTRRYTLNFRQLRHHTPHRVATILPTLNRPSPQATPSLIPYALCLMPYPYSARKNRPRAPPSTRGLPHTNPSKKPSTNDQQQPLLLQTKGLHSRYPPASAVATLIGRNVNVSAAAAKQAIPAGTNAQSHAWASPIAPPRIGPTIPPTP